MMKNFLLTTISIFLLAACKEDEQHPSINYTSFLNCLNSQVWDSTTIAKQMVGSWKLYAISCVWVAPNIDTMDVIVDLHSSGTYTVWYHSAIHSTGKWSIGNKNPYDSTNLELYTIPHEGYISGKIFPCPDQVLFYESGYDLCDKAYDRIK